VDVCSSLRCSAQSGHAQNSPHVHPEPAIDAIILMGGISGKSGTWWDGVEDDDGEVRIGGKDGPGAEPCWLAGMYLRRL
jgi:hypothetical protein